MGPTELSHKANQRWEELQSVLTCKHYCTVHTSETMIQIEILLLSVQNKLDPTTK